MQRAGTISSSAHVSQHCLPLLCAAGWLTREDMTVSLYPQLSIIAMQSVLLFMFWNTIVHMEDQLVPLNKVIENSPHHAKASVQCAGAAGVRCSPSQQHFKVPGASTPAHLSTLVQLELQPSGHVLWLRHS